MSMSQVKQCVQAGTHRNTNRKTKKESEKKEKKERSSAHGGKNELQLPQHHQQNSLTKPLSKIILLLTSHYKFTSITC